MGRGLTDLLADGLDDLPLPGDDLESLGDVFANLHDAVRPAAGAGGGRFELFALQLHLVDQPGSAFRAVAIVLAPEFGDLQC